MVLYSVLGISGSQFVQPKIKVEKIFENFFEIRQIPPLENPRSAPASSQVRANLEFVMVQ